ncbi:helix-turn-helix transcriptional regulator [Curtobacterium luteum]|uniref:helix-turn-helix transcriptional regulator n=1 Tax=Curtobacterium luteum TaxID=33881 RepID=UPI0007374A65|nr:LuxR C-terminal-related transcriptional regulator [Curtobacterium luteum]
MTETVPPPAAPQIAEAAARALFETTGPPPVPVRRSLAQSVPELATGIDPVRTLGAAAALVDGAWAGVVLLLEQGVVRLPGLSDDAFLRPGSALVAAARDVISDGANHTSFLWPRTRATAQDDFVRVTVTACERGMDTVAFGVVVLSPATGLRGLTPRELEVLGHLVEGCSNTEIARALAVTPRTVAAHIEHILAKLNATSRTLAAVRAERAGLYIPLTAAGLL